ncbi:MAG: NAD(P)/FAD-dependent oxidoreductase [Ruminococcaceae bacterium]|nr:NAD(P)/FAD-dependent oxidoreductase [Oscillospiraceae bacterium]
MKQAIIIGAGPAGLTAAYKLLESGEFDITVLESTASFGGISQTVKYNGNRMDIGGHRFFSKDKDVVDFWTSLLPVQGSPSVDDKVFDRKKEFSVGGPDPEKSDAVMLIRDRISRIYYKGKFFDYPVTLKWETLKNMGFLTTVKAGFSYLAARVRKLPEDNLENFYINRFGKVLYSMFFEGYTEKLWGRHPSEISADWGSQRVKGLSITAVLKDMFAKIFGKKQQQKETSLIESFMYPKLGPGQLWETLAERITEKGGKVHLNCTVKTLNTDGDKITSVVYDENGTLKTLDADVVFSSMPLNELIDGLKTEIPEAVTKAAAGLPFRDFQTVGLLVNKLKLKNKTDYQTLGGIVPDCWIYVQDTSVRLGRLQIFNNWSPYLVKDAENTVWIGLEYFCNEGDELWEKSDEDFINLAVDELVKIGVIDRSAVLDSHRERIKKAYPAYFDTYSDIGLIIDFLNRFDNLFCIGRNGQHRYNNMDHSMVTAFKAVDVALGISSDRSAVWNVNTEKDYHEESK